MALPRIDDKEEAEEYGIETFPAMVYFDKVTQVKERLDLFSFSPEDPKPLFWGAGHRWHPCLDDRANGGKSHRGRLRRDPCHAHQVRMKPLNMDVDLRWKDYCNTKTTQHWKGHFMSLILVQLVQCDVFYADIDAFFHRKHDDITVFFYDSDVKQERWEPLDCFVLTIV